MKWAKWWSHRALQHLGHPSILYLPFPAQNCNAQLCFDMINYQIAIPSTTQTNKLTGDIPAYGILSLIASLYVKPWGNLLLVSYNLEQMKLEFSQEHCLNDCGGFFLQHDLTLSELSVQACKFNREFKHHK